jgi:hypothetical protein
MEKVEEMTEHAIKWTRDINRYLFGVVAEAMGLPEDTMFTGTGICRVAIMTQGIKDKVVGFEGQEHKDKNDKLPKMVQREIEMMVKDVMSSEEEQERLVEKYLETMKKVFGDLSLPTTCEYTHINKYKSRELKAYFLFPKWGLAFRIRDQFCHLFYAAFADHCTSVAYYTVDDKVHLKMSDDSCLFAWGASSNQAAAPPAEVAPPAAPRAAVKK